MSDRYLDARGLNSVGPASVADEMLGFALPGTREGLASLREKREPRFG